MTPYDNQPPFLETAPAAVVYLVYLLSPSVLDKEERNQIIINLLYVIFFHVVCDMRWVLVTFSDFYFALKYLHAVGCACSYGNWMCKQVFTHLKVRPVTPSLHLAFSLKVFFFFPFCFPPLLTSSEQMTPPLF